MCCTAAFGTKNAEKGNEKNILFIIEKFFIFSPFFALKHTHDSMHAHMEKVIMNESRLFYAYVSLMSFRVKLNHVQVAR